MKNRREYIVRKAMELYALEGYYNVSITDLQNALEIGRGTLYYHFKDQEELFMTCMEQYILEPKQHALNSVNNDVTVEQMIHTMLKYLGCLEEALMTFDNKRINTSHVNNLMFAAYSLFPTLHRKAQRLALKEVDLWRKAIYNSQRLGIIKHGIDVDQIALMFAHIKNSYDNGLGRAQMNFQLLEKTYYALYNLLKNE
jgi:AcrR family transcriptional regulator